MSEIKRYDNYQYGVVENPAGDYIARADLDAESIRAVISLLQKHSVELESMLNMASVEANALENQIYDGFLAECMKHIAYFENLLRVAG